MTVEAMPLVAENTIGGGVRRPGHLAAPVRLAGPDVDDRLPVEVDRQRPAAEPAAGEHAGEAANRACKMGVRCAVTHHACVRGIVGGDRAAIDFECLPSRTRIYLTFTLPAEQTKIYLPIC